MAGGALLRLLVAVVLLAQLAVLSQFLIAPSTSVPLGAIRIAIGIATTEIRLPLLLRTLDTIAAQRFAKTAPKIEVHVFSDDPAYPSERLPRWVKFHSVADKPWFSAAKLLGLLQLYGTTASEPLLLTADDDQLYEPTWVETLLSQQVAVPAPPARAAIGLRGWRIRREADGFEYGVARPKSDGVWGSFPAVATYVVLGSQLARPWQVGVATGGCGVLLRPNFFDDSVFRPPPEAPSGILVVDDVWMNGMLARRNVTRWIVPTGGALHCDEGRHHLGHGAASAVDATLRERRWPGRAALNQQALRFFGDAWERGVLHDARIRPPWRRAHAALVGLSDLILWLHSCAAVRAVVPDFFL